MTLRNLPVPAPHEQSTGDARPLQRPDATPIVAPLRQRAELATRSRARSLGFAAGMTVGVLLATVIAVLIEPPLPVAFFLIYLPGAVILGLLTERLPLHRVFTGADELELDRLEARHHQRIAEIEALTERLRAAGLSPEEITPRLEAAYSAEHAEHLLELEDFTKDPRRALPPAS